MALKNKITGEYIRVGKEKMLSRILLQLFENSEHRESGDNNFKKHKEITIFTTKLINKLDTEVLNNITKSVYELLKEEKENIPGEGLVLKYKDWEDC